jgi:hypothetical protein
MFGQSDDNRELWIGSSKNLAANYVKKFPCGHKFIYEGRINGKLSTDRMLLMELEILIISKIYGIKPAIKISLKLS